MNSEEFLNSSLAKSVFKNQILKIDFHKSNFKLKMELYNQNLKIDLQKSNFTSKIEIEKSIFTKIDFYFYLLYY